MKIFIFICLSVFFSCVEFTGSTECYICYSWKDPGCEEDYIVNVNLTTCGVPPLPPSSFWRGDRDRDREREERNLVLNAPPSTCVKEVTTFIDPPIRSQNDRYNRFNRPWVERKCGNLIQGGYRSGRDLVEECETVEVIIDGVAGIKRTCSCSTDGCNSAATVKLDLLLAFAIFPLLRGMALMVYENEQKL